MPIRRDRPAVLFCALRILCLLAAAQACTAGELDLTVGDETSSHTGGSYTWGIEYRQPFSEHLSGSFTWLNEGHLLNHHRDGQAVQVWWRSKQHGPGLVFEGGIGPYHYYDTTDAQDVETASGPQLAYENAHGWGVLASAAMDWYFKHGWFAMLRVNDIEGAGQIRSTALALGVGYRFGDGADEHFHRSNSGFGSIASRWEFDGMAGRAVLNSFHSEESSAQALSLRAKLSPHFAASLTYTVAHDVPLDWHSGTAVQIWAETPLTNSFAAGAGVGAFITSERGNGNIANSSPNPVAGIFGVTLAYGIGSRWVARAIWNRVATRDDSDSDIVLLGVGYRF